MIFILLSFLSKIIPEKRNPPPGNRYFRKKIISQGGYHHREYSGAVFTKTYKYSRSAGQTIIRPQCFLPYQKYFPNSNYFDRQLAFFIAQRQITLLLDLGG
jgi:hypothetical protein